MPPDFSQRIYQLVRCIPSGCVASYGQLAALAGYPRHARFVGRLMAHCTDPCVPCHRVVRSDGSLCPDDAFGIPGLQRHRLLEEGVLLLPNGCVDMDAYRWSGLPK